MPNLARNLSPVNQYFLGIKMGMLRQLPNAVGDLLRFVGHDEVWYANGNEDHELAEKVFPLVVAARKAYADLCFQLLEANPSAWGDYREVTPMTAREGEVIQPAQARLLLDYMIQPGSYPMNQIASARTALLGIVATPGLNIPSEVVAALFAVFDQVQIVYAEVRDYCISKAA